MKSINDSYNVAYILFSFIYWYIMHSSIKLSAVSFAILTLIVGCSGGSDAPQGSATNSAVGVTGAVVKGPSSNASVCFYELLNTGKGAKLACTNTSADGNYSLNLSYAGAVFMEASGGSYTDEATGLTTNLTSPLTSVGVISGNGGVVVATPLTTIAVEQAIASGNLTLVTFNASAGNVSSTFGVTGSITTTVPNVTLGSNNSYGAALTTVSKLVHGGVSLANITKTSNLSRLQQQSNAAAYCVVVAQSGNITSTPLGGGVFYTNVTGSNSPAVATSPLRFAPRAAPSDNITIANTTNATSVNITIPASINLSGNISTFGTSIPSSGIYFSNTSNNLSGNISDISNNTLGNISYTSNNTLGNISSLGTSNSNSGIYFLNTSNNLSGNISTFGTSNSNSGIHFSNTSATNISFNSSNNTAINTNTTTNNSGIYFSNNATINTSINSSGASIFAPNITINTSAANLTISQITNATIVRYLNPFASNSILNITLVNSSNASTRFIATEPDGTWRGLITACGTSAMGCNISKNTAHQVVLDCPTNVVLSAGNLSLYSGLWLSQVPSITSLPSSGLTIMAKRIDIVGDSIGTVRPTFNNSCPANLQALNITSPNT